jgi:hypothetical protein
MSDAALAVPSQARSQNPRRPLLHADRVERYGYDARPRSSRPRKAALTLCCQYRGANPGRYGSRYIPVSAERVGAAVRWPAVGLFTLARQGSGRGNKRPLPRRSRPCSSMTLTAAPPGEPSVRAGRHRVRDRPERRTRQRAARGAGALSGRRAAGQRRCPPASADRAAGPSGRAEHHRGPRVGQSPGHRGQRPRPGTCRAGGQIQSGHRAVRPGPAGTLNVASCGG